MDRQAALGDWRADWTPPLVFPAPPTLGRSLPLPRGDDVTWSAGIVGFVVPANNAQLAQAGVSVPGVGGGIVMGAPLRPPDRSQLLLRGLRLAGGWWATAQLPMVQSRALNTQIALQLARETGTNSLGLRTTHGLAAPPVLPGHPLCVWRCVYVSSVCVWLCWRAGVLACACLGRPSRAWPGSLDRLYGPA